MDFIPAAELKKSYDVFGHFYSVILKSGETIDCRSILEIGNKDILPANIDSLSDQPADAIFIMMNPGSSKPLVEVNNTLSWKDINKLETSIVPTKPDTTQYQVMRVMHYCNWNHVRVLNISDLRDPKSENFKKHFCEIENQTGFTPHSIFDEERSFELQSKLKRKAAAPIVCAWGVSDDLTPLIDRCLDKIGNRPLTGLLKENNKYYHPLPTLQKGKIEWVNKMIESLRA